MPKLDVFGIPPNAVFPPANNQRIVHTLAQPRKSRLKQTPRPANIKRNFKPETLQSADKKKIKKRARAKWFTQSYLQHLIDLDSPLKKSYLNTLFCSHTIEQKEDKLTAKYCNNRWCMVCNRIRIAKAINGYLPALQEMADPQFVTLTIPNVKKHELWAAIEAMVGSWKQIKDCMRKRKQALRGIRKIECTYNADEDSYHPHFHLIVEGKQAAEVIVCEWLDRWPEARMVAQDVRPADDRSMIELFKYFTKVVTKNNLFISALDQIFNAMKERRVFQPFGIRKVSEDVDEIQSEVIEGIEIMTTYWEWLDCDWINQGSGKPLTGFIPSEKLKRLVQNVIL